MPARAVHSAHGRDAGRRTDGRDVGGVARGADRRVAAGDGCGELGGHGTLQPGRAARAGGEDAADAAGVPVSGGTASVSGPGAPNGCEPRTYDSGALPGNAVSRDLDTRTEPVDLSVPGTPARAQPKLEGHPD